jgi:SAM-dependent methyltransferase
MKAHEYAAMFDAEQRHWWYQNLRNEVAYWMRRGSAAKAASKKKLLDLGCGTGGMLWHVQTRFENLAAFGMDYHSLALDFARRRTIYSLLRGDVKKMPFHRKSFDFILCLDVLYTKEAYPGFQNTLGEIHELLRESGVFILQLPAFECLKSQHDLNCHGMHRFTADEIRQSLHQAGFSRYKVYYRYNLLFGFAWFLRKILKSEENKSQVSAPMPLINFLLYSYFALESWLNKRLPVPFGVSVFAVAHR